MKHGSLFSGIGGFDLAAEWMNWENVFHCEWNDFGKQVLKYYWPKAISYDDITKTDFTIHRGKIDILTGGFPCQPYSQAGKRKGKEDDRHLWPEMLRAIREIQPQWIVGENVLGLVNWNGGLVFEEVQSDLEAEGYEVQPYVLPAASVGAPHQRYRIWFVAYSINGGRQEHGFCARWEMLKNRIEGSGITSNSNNFGGGRIRNENEKTRSQKSNELFGGKYRISSEGNVAHAQCIRPSREEYREKKSGQYSEKDKGCRWQNFPTQSPICNGNDGISSRLDGITFPKWRNESIKAGGNAIVPQVVHQIFKTIEEFSNLKK